MAQKADRRETTSEGFGWELFQQYTRAWKESGCKYFLYENNYSMADAIKDEITKHLGVEPIMINSALVSAQNRKRYYWTNIPNVTVPSDKGILLADIIESGTVDRDKSLCIARRYAGFNGTQSYLCRRYFGKSFGQAIFEGNIEDIKAKWKENPYFESDEKNIRQMTLRECERLQTLPDDYTNVDGVSTKMKYESIGNGWTVDVIAHILSFLPDEYKNKKEIKQMELRVNEVTLPEQIAFNYEELKAELTEKVSIYETMVYTEEQIKDAKEDKANLNKLKKALNDERIRREKEYMQPFNEFKAKVNEIISIIDKPVAVIDRQVKEYEERLKQEKLEKINEYMKEIEAQLPDDVHIPLEPKWLNASVSMKSIKDSINIKAEQIKNDIATLSNLPEFSFEAVEVYKTSLDINKALNEAHRLSEIAKKKAEMEAQRKAREEEQARIAAEIEAKKSEFIPPTPTEEEKAFEEKVFEQHKEEVEEEFIPDFSKPAKQWITIKALMTEADMQAVVNVLVARGIEYTQI